MTRENLIEILSGYYDRPVKHFENKSNKKLVNLYLRFNGIIGYTDNIIEVIEAAYNVKLEQ